MLFVLNTFVKNFQLLSILIPTYNYDITALVNAVHLQCIESEVMFEIIVLDDFSTIRYKEVNRKIVSMPHCRYLENTTNFGRTLSRKKLADAAIFNTLLFLDADVIPVSEHFIENYMTFIGYRGVVIGGIAYEKNAFNSNTALRQKYGQEREEKTATERNKNPYGSIFSGNLLLPKDVFLENNYPEKNNLYGMDIYFAYSLYKNKVPVTHTDNPIYHLGLEDNAIFFRKSIEAVKNRKELLTEAKRVEDMNSLLKHYKILKKYQLTPVVSLLFKIAAPLLKKMIMKKDPNLFCFDLYRLGYICAIK